jgi:hypothetical protein
LSERPKIAPATVADVLMLSRRRCCLCFALNHDSGEKKGQVAHLDRDRDNNRGDNLAFLCLDHHDQYDSRTSQAKGLTMEEVKRYRAMLHRHVTQALPLSDVQIAKVLPAGLDRPTSDPRAVIGTQARSGERAGAPRLEAQTTAGPLNDFSEKVRQAIAFRAQFVCSFPGCDSITVGPSSASNAAYVNSGEAAHIHSAAANGPRHLPTMTPEECVSILNAVWLCGRHHRMVDADPAAYPADLLRQWRDEREKQARADHEGGRSRPGRQLGRDLISIGRDICAVGDIVGSSGSQWDVRLDEFVFGDVRSLTTFGEEFATRSHLDRFVLVESFGEGRVLAAAPVWRREGNSFLLRLEVCPPASRIPAQQLGADIALTENGDIPLRWNLVGGVEALPQKIRLCMSYQKAGSALFTEFGSRLSEFVALYSDSLLLDRLLMIEVIRLACIPYQERFLGKDLEYTPFNCVSRVISFRFVERGAVGEWWPASIELDVVGLGRWKNDLKIFVGKHPPPPPPAPPSADPTNFSLAGPPRSPDEPA